MATTEVEELVTAAHVMPGQPFPDVRLEVEVLRVGGATIRSAAISTPYSTSVVSFMGGHPIG